MNCSAEANGLLPISLRSGFDHPCGMSLLMGLRKSSPTMCKAKHLFLLARTAAGHEGG